MAYRTIYLHTGLKVNHLTSDMPIRTEEGVAMHIELLEELGSGVKQTPFSRGASGGGANLVLAVTYRAS
jgi:hypothetical protein